MYNKPYNREIFDKEKNPVLDEEILKFYAYYQKERTSVYNKKEILKLDKPFSDDILFQKFKFTNTKRYLDRESLNLINGIIDREDITYNNKILNCILFRLINKWDIFKILPNNYIDFENLKEEDFSKIENIIIESKIKGWFTSAYFISGTLRALKLKQYGSDANIPKGGSNPLFSTMVLIRYVFDNKEHFLEINDKKDPNDILNHIVKTYGIGKFIGYQIFADWSYIKEFPFDDNSCVDIGPGTERGLKHLFKDFDGMSLKESVYWLQYNIQRLMDERGYEWDLEKWFYFLKPEQRVWTLQDITNSFCELDKCTRIMTPELQELNGKRVRKYNN